MGKKRRPINGDGHAGHFGKRSHRDKSSQERTLIPKSMRFGKLDQADGGRNPIRAGM
jgi:hypothetical protein